MSTNNKRILIFSTAYLPFVGGAEIAVKEIIDRLDGYDFEMITLNLDGKQKAEEQVGKVLVHRIGSGSYISKILFTCKAPMLARQLHKRKAFDITWSIMASFSGFAALFFKFRYPKVPFVLTLQEGDPLSRPKRRAALVWPLFVQIFRRANRIQTISHYLADFAKKMGAKAPIEVIPNGVDLPLFTAPVNPGEKQVIEQYLPQVTTRLITISRLVEKNGVGDIIDALKLLPAHVGLFVVGTGSLEKKLKEKAASLGLATRIYFAGLVDYKNLPKWLAASDIFVRPSLSEGMGNSFIEAMAAGVPIIGTNVGGIPDFLRDGETGLFCQPKNPASIAEAVKKIVADQGLRQKLVDQGKKLANTYDWGSIAEKISSGIFKTL